MGRSAKAELFRMSLAVSGWLDTTNRVNPTEKDINGMAWRDPASPARARWAAVPERARTIPGGPGIER